MITTIKIMSIIDLSLFIGYYSERTTTKLLAKYKGKATLSEPGTLSLLM
jgi:hypothetical protein